MLMAGPEHDYSSDTVYITTAATSLHRHHHHHHTTDILRLSFIYDGLLPYLPTYIIRIHAGLV